MQSLCIVMMVCVWRRDVSGLKLSVKVSKYISRAYIVDAHHQVMRDCHQNDQSTVLFLLEVWSEVCTAMSMLCAEYVSDAPHAVFV